MSLEALAGFYLQVNHINITAQLHSKINFAIFIHYQQEPGLALLFAKCH